MNWKSVANSCTLLGHYMKSHWTSANPSARTTAGRNHELSRSLQRDYGMSQSEADSELGQFEHKYQGRQWLKRRRKSDPSRRSVAVYRIRFWDINTNSSVLSEGLMTENAANREHVRIDPGTKVEVSATDVRNGRYIPPG